MKYTIDEWGCCILSISWSYGASKLGIYHEGKKMYFFIFLAKLYKPIPNVFNIALKMFPGDVVTRDGHADAGICGSCGLCAYSWMCRCGSGWKSHPHYPRINICKKLKFFGQEVGQPGSIFNSECQKISLLFILSWFYPSSGIQV